MMLMTACGRDGSFDAPSKHFTSRTQNLFEGRAEPGDLELEITNDIPKVEAPAPHLPTVVHLNAQICSRTSDLSRTNKIDDGNSVYEAPRGALKCINLSPSIFFATTVQYTIKKDTIATLLSDDYDALEVSFASSTQTTSHQYFCGSEVMKFIYRPEEINREKVTVNGQHSISFNCR